jgi:nitrate reductase NapAB chaperone NapD
MGKMKALLIDREEDNQEFDVVMEEMHYINTINDVVKLMLVYGQLKVLMDITTKMIEEGR